MATHPTDSAEPRDPEQPTLSVIIVNWNVRDMLRDCLRSLFAEACATGPSMEVIVVDNDSKDGSVEMIRGEFPSVVLVVNPRNTGFGHANNTGLLHSRGRFICLLNPDTVVLDGAIDKALQYLEDHPDVGMVGPRLLNSDGSLQRWTAGDFPTLANIAAHHLLLSRILPPRLQPRPLFLRDDTRAPMDVGWLSGACMLLRRESFGDTLFDERFFMYGEDMELCYRLRRRGWRVVYYPIVSIHHHLGGSIRRQTSTDVQAAALRGPRIFYAMIQPNRVARRGVDLLVVAGFLLRWVLYSAATFLSSKPRFSTQAIASRRYLSIAVASLFERRST